MTNDLRIRLLTEIDQNGAACASPEELAAHFRHPDHTRNWAAQWNLIVNLPDIHGRTWFQRNSHHDSYEFGRDYRDVREPFG